MIDLKKIILLSKIKRHVNKYEKLLNKHGFQRTTYREENRYFGCIECRKDFSLTLSMGDAIYIEKGVETDTYHISCALKNIGVKK